jgi:hypothetical protein
MQARRLTIAVLASAAFTVSSWYTVAAANVSAVFLSRPLTNQRPSTADQYFVEFRSRDGYLFGHTFIVFGRLGRNGQPLEIRYAGLYPLDGQRGLVVGSILPVAASIRAIEEDFKARTTNHYRRKLTSAQYTRLKAAVRYATANENYWQMIFANCNDFAIVIAKSIDLRTPSSWLLPVTFVAQLRVLNG